MLTSFDDFPIHQAAVPVSQTACSDLNFYDRYFFNGYDHDGSTYFALAMGLYPNRHVADAHSASFITTSRSACSPRNGHRWIDAMQHISVRSASTSSSRCASPV